MNRLASSITRFVAVAPRFAAPRVVQLAPISTSSIKMGKDSGEPKRPMSAYILFSQDARASVLAENPGIAAKDVMSKLGEMWRGLSDAEKRPYEEKAAEAKAEYTAAGHGGKGSGKPKKAAGGKKSKGEEGEKVKRGPNPYMIFSNEKRQEVVDANPGIKVTEVSKIIGGMWKELSDKEKDHYKHLSEKAKAH